ncbi:MMPL family transporter [Leifsonia xyli]|uniref:MMPL family transporter n=1 Tax=Leifsonia xyli TaxID=1575 RepID=UPI003D66FAF8
MAALLSRLGRFSARHRVAVIIGWIALLVILAVTALSGMRFSSGAFDVPGTQSSKALALLDRKFPTQKADTKSVQLVVESPAGTQITGEQAIKDVAQATTTISRISEVASVSDPYNAQQPYISKDLTTAVSTIAVEKVGADAVACIEKKLDAVAAELRTDGYTAEIGGTLESAVPEILGPSEIVGAIIAFVVLLLTFGSLVAAGANMGGALIGVGVGILGVLATSAFAPIGSITPILAVMLGLAVGIDYGLFLLARVRHELRTGRSVEDSISRAVGTAGLSVLFAGATVVIALAGLLVVGIPFLGEMGLAAAAAVVVAVLMAITFLPAVASFAGRRLLPRRERGRTSPARPARGPRFLPAWIRAVRRRPALSLAAAAALLVVVALPLTSMTTSLAIPGGEDPKSTERAAYDLVAEKFGAGAQDPLVVLVHTRAGTAEAATTAAASQIQKLRSVSMVIPSGVSDDGTVGRITVFSTAGPLAETTKALVHDIRGDVHVSGAAVIVTGSTAMGIDSDERLRDALVTYLAIIVGLALVLLIILFRSILVPLIATAGFLLSLGAGLGTTTAVFQWGWLDSVVQAPQGNPLLSLLPLILTGIIFGLAMDYQVFLVSRMREAYVHGADPREAVLMGFRESAVVVVAAAGIMAAVFGGFALSPSSLVGSIALGLAAGVVADAFIVRMIIMPAALFLLGKTAWWIPKWLDRILPVVDVEGDALTEDTHRPLVPVG